MTEIKKFLAEVDAHPEWGRIEVSQPFIEEVRELFEKATSKKPVYSDFEENDDGDGIIPTRAECPYCGYEFEFGTWNESENHHCVCGQAIDWSSNDY